MDEAREKKLEDTKEEERVDEQKCGSVKAVRGATSYNISWQGSSGATNAASVSTYYTGGSLFVSAIASGTASWGTACVVTATPTNYKLKNGNASVACEVESTNFGKSYIIDVTPAAKYKNTTVRVSMSVSSSKGMVIYVHGSIE